MRSSCYNHAAPLDRFYQELIGGMLHGVRVRPALTLDLHDLYQAWCNRANLPSIARSGYLVQLLVARHAAKSLRKRYAIGDRIWGPHGMLYLVPFPAPPRGYEDDWLGQNIVAFRASVDAYKAMVRPYAHA